MYEVLEGFPATFTYDMNVTLSKDITERELLATVQSMAKGKAPGHYGIPIELFQKLWLTIGHDFHRIILRGAKEGVLHEGVTKGLINLIFKEGDAKEIELLEIHYPFDGQL